MVLVQAFTQSQHSTGFFRAGMAFIFSLLFCLSCSETRKRILFYGKDTCYDTSGIRRYSTQFSWGQRQILRIWTAHSRGKSLHDFNGIDASTPLFFFFGSIVSRIDFSLHHLPPCIINTIPPSSSPPSHPSHSKQQNFIL